MGEENFLVSKVTTTKRPQPDANLNTSIGIQLKDECSSFASIEIPETIYTPIPPRINQSYPTKFTAEALGPRPDEYNAIRPAENKDNIIDKTLGNFDEGVMDLLKDPTFLAMVAASYWASHYDKPGKEFDFPAFGFEKQFVNAIGKKDRSSLGAINPGYYPAIFITGQFVGAIVADILGTNVSAGYYRDIGAMLTAMAVVGGGTQFIKNHFSRTRPDGSDNSSFISGHSSIAAGTSVLLIKQAFNLINSLNTDDNGKIAGLSKTQWKSLVVGVFGGWALYVGTSRMLDKKHYPLDVASGLAFGATLAWWASGKLGFNLKMKNKNMSLRPYYNPFDNRIGMNFSLGF